MIIISVVINYKAEKMFSKFTYRSKQHLKNRTSSHFDIFKTSHIFIISFSVPKFLVL